MTDLGDLTLKKLGADNKKSIKEAWLTGCITAILTVVLTPILTFAFGYLGGMIVNWVFGARLVDGLNLIFDTTRFTRDLIPLSCATLATIGRYFKTSVSSK